MSAIQVKYLGLDLKSPVIVSSCSLTADVDKVREMERCGAGAVVMKSLFEEQIRGEVEFMASAGQSYPEMEDYLHAYVRSNSIARYTERIKALKDAVSIPVIASINCYSAGEWVEYARQIEAAGADAIEINIYDLSTNPKTSSSSLEDGYIKVVKSIVSELRIPVSVKIGQHFTNIVNFVDRLDSVGAKGVVIFNRFFTPDIDIEHFKLVPAAPLSQGGEYPEVLRWTAILSSIGKIDIAATTGIHTPETAVKMILAGADAVQICSAVYKHGPGVITEFNNRIVKFLEDNTVESLDQIRGRLNYSAIHDPAMYERVQFMKTFGSLAL
ncbi:MAG TPA: dihydroorotate dehydrogenase-like protein [Candidatus Coprenecus pullistercoris]|nr:dihydroorotate dehydrogenase-like protein [Candidatus Coprenecus pullistercoris]